MDELKSQLPVILRYALTYLVAMLVGRGVLPAEMAEPFTSAVVAFAIAGVGLAPMLWALWKKPSTPALEVAKRFDAQVPAGTKVEDVKVITPPSKDDILLGPVQTK